MAMMEMTVPKTRTRMNQIICPAMAKKNPEQMLNMVRLMKVSTASDSFSITTTASESDMVSAFTGPNIKSQLVRYGKNGKALTYYLRYSIIKAPISF